MELDFKKFYRKIDYFPFSARGFESIRCNTEDFENLNKSIEKIISNFKNQEDDSPDIDYRVKFSLPKLNSLNEFLNFDKKILETCEWYNILIGKTVYQGKTHIFVNINSDFYFYLSNENINDNFYATQFEEIINAFDAYFDLIILLFEKNIYSKMLKYKNYKYRYGTITCGDYWRCHHEIYKNTFEDYTESAKERLLYELKMNNEYEFATHYEKMSANQYYKDCSIAFKVFSRYNPKLTFKENFYRNADGRVQGLKDINDDSFEEFETWYKENEHHFDHTFEIYPGHSQYRIKLHISKDDNGYFYIIGGSHFTTLLKIGNIFLRYLEEGIRISVSRSDKLIEVLEGSLILDVVPDYYFFAFYSEEVSVSDLRKKNFIKAVKRDEEIVPTFTKKK